jgi:hypothetical protein
MKFRDEGDAGCVAIASNGMKFRFSNEEIELAEKKLNPPKPKRKRKPRPKPVTKKPAAKKPATKSKAPKQP